MPQTIRTEHGQLTLYTRQEAAGLLGVSDRTLRQYIYDERLPAQKIGGRWLVSEINLMAFLSGAKPKQRKNQASGYYARKGQRVDAPEYGIDKLAARQQQAELKATGK